jgi:RNA polymerase sigma-B factor
MTIVERDCGRGDATDLHHLVESHLGLAWSLAQRYQGRGEPLDDIYQAACEGLVGAARRFDPDRGIEFSTYATACIAGEIKRHFRGSAWRLHVARGDQERYLRARNAIDELRTVLGREPAVGEVADSLGVQDEAVVEALGAGRAFSPRSLQVQTADGQTYDEVLGGVDERFDKLEWRLLARRLQAILPPEDAEFIRLRFYEMLTQAEIADRCGISPMQASRSLRRILERLRGWAGTVT